jgi:hypothetical protein
VERSVHENDYLFKLDSDAEGWAESERERELMAVLVEAAHLRSAARAWYRSQGLLDDLTQRTEASQSRSDELEVGRSNPRHLLVDASLAGTENGGRIEYEGKPDSRRQALPGR